MLAVLLLIENKLRLCADILFNPELECKLSSSSCLAQDIYLDNISIKISGFLWKWGKISNFFYCVLTVWLVVILHFTDVQVSLLKKINNVTIMQITLIFKNKSCLFFFFLEIPENLSTFLPELH